MPEQTPPPSPSQITEKDFTRLVNTVPFEDLVRYLRSPWRIIWTNLLAGIARGIGIFISMTIILGIFVWILGQFINFPVIGSYFDQMKTSMEKVSNLQMPKFQ